MDQVGGEYALVIPAILSLLFFILSKLRKKKCQLPCPPSLPIIGHLHLLKQPLHRTLQQFSIKYGRIYTMRFGYRPVIIISSPAIAHECFTKHDIILANRPRLLAGKHLHYEWTTLGTASYGPLWRNLRRLTTHEILSNTRLNMFTDLRDQEMRFLVRTLFGYDNKEFVRVDMRPKFSELSYNIIMKMVTGKRYFGIEAEKVEEAKVFSEIVRDVFELTGRSNPMDFLPFPNWIARFLNIEGKMLTVRKRMDNFLDSLLDECRGIKSDRSGKDGEIAPMIYNLLDLQASDPANYSDEVIKGTIMVLLAAGSDTSVITMEWALSLLLNHPNVLQRARIEIDNYVGKERLVDESDLPKLSCLYNIINETLRLFPVAPLLAAHESSEDCNIAGYHVQKGTMVLINAWEIHRDPMLWEEPLSFRPERFERADVDDYKLNLIPFGLGRRSCPGTSLANKVIGLSLAALIQCFDWERVGEENVDLSEFFSLTMHKTHPLEAMC